MDVLLFGATGMIGQGVLREALRDPEIRRVTAVGRSASGQRHEKLRDVAAPDLMNLAAVERDLTGYDACIFSLGVTAVGLNEAQYSAITYDLTVSVATTLARLNPAITFIYVSGQGTDPTEKGSTMWARVKGRTENALLVLPIKAYMFRPGLIVPLHGIKSRTGWYNAFYAVAKPMYPLLRRLVPGSVTTTEQLGRAMIAVAKKGYPKRILETSDFNRL